MNEIEALNLRKSRRNYTSTPIEDNIIKHFNQIISSYNTKENLHIQFVKNGSKAFSGFKNSYGMLTGVQSFIALVGTKSDPNLYEKLGYYGELLCIEATKLNLGTCFVGGTYNKKLCPCELELNEELVCVITIGHVAKKLGLKENTMYKLIRRSSKTLEQLYHSTSKEVPDWFIEGMKAVQKAPSAINKQPATFEYQNGIITASVPDQNEYQRIDLGIAKANFQIVVQRGTWEWGNSGKLVY